MAHGPRTACALIVVAFGATVLGRIASVPGPFGPNDLSRWATVAALLETGDYSIGRRVDHPDGSYQDLKAPVLIDVLLHPETRRFYSSKPPLLPAMFALELRVLEGLGFSVKDHGLVAIRLLLVTFNAIPMLMCLALIARILLRVEDSTAILLVIVAAFGTAATPFAITLTNHVPATAGAGVATYALWKIWDGDSRVRTYVAAGLASGWVASQEVPALAFPVCLGLLLGLRDRGRTLAAFAPAAALPIALFCATNHAALGDPIYFYHPHPIWSKFPGSYWANKQGIDAGERSHLAYVFHFTFGHHGVFSLAPIFLFAIAAAVRAFGYRVLAFFAVVLAVRYAYKDFGAPLAVVMLVLGAPAIAALLFPLRWWKEASFDEALVRLGAAATAVTLGFYLVHTSNYGGVSSAPRWVMWLAPLWLVSAAPILRSGGRRLFALGLAAAAVSIFSATYPSSNPWVHPWIYALFAA